MDEHPKRSLVKTLSWRFVATVTTVLLVFVFTGHLAMSLSVGAVEVVSKIILYYGHERVWDRIKWGRMHN